MSVMLLAKTMTITEKNHYRAPQTAEHTKYKAILYTVNPCIIHPHAWLGPLKGLHLKKKEWTPVQQERCVCLYIKTAAKCQSPETLTYYWRWILNVWWSENKCSIHEHAYLNWGNLWGMSHGWWQLQQVQESSSCSSFSTALGCLAVNKGKGNTGEWVIDSINCFFPLPHPPPLCKNAN